MLLAINSRSFASLRMTKRFASVLQLLHTHGGVRSVSDILGIHHVTAIASDPQRNIDFFAGLLGLRLVKRTVNFDDPETYHLYYGDEVGTPGCIMTFFPWPGAKPGRQGPGECAVVSFSVAPAAIGFWLERFV